MSKVNGFTVLTDSEFQRTVVSKLIPTVDTLRDLNSQFGLRPYRVRIVRTRWSDGVRGRGAEYITGEMEILPVPKVEDLSAIAEVLQPIGLDEVGGIRVSEISGRYTEDHLRGRDFDGVAVADDEQVFWEVEFLRSDSRPGERRRFNLRGLPYYDASKLQWIVMLERARGDRTRAGELR